MVADSPPPPPEQPAEQQAAAPAGAVGGGGGAGEAAVEAVAAGAAATAATAPTHVLNQERFNVFNEGLLFYATKLLLKELKMDTGDGAQSGEDTDRELDCMLELPAARKPLNSPEEVLQYWNSCFEKEELSHLHFR